jgi:hypothetical protein
MPSPSTTPRLNLSDALTDKTYQAIGRIAYECGVQPDDIADTKYLCWVIELLKHVRDTPNNFPRGKWNTIKTLERLVDEAANEVVKLLYGNV